jgi:hypothetical protein
MQYHLNTLWYSMKRSVLMTPNAWLKYIVEKLPNPNQSI